MLLKLLDTLHTGIIELDEDHKKIIDLINNIYMQIFSEKYNINDLIFSVYDAFKKHSLFEEKIMLELNYPKLNEQKIDHSFIRKSLNSLENYDGKDKVEEFLDIVNKKIIGHLYEEDIKIVAFMKGN